MNAADWVVPCVIAGIFLWGLARGVNVFDAFTAGAREGLRTAAEILPALVCLLTAVAMFRASGALRVLTAALAPAARLLGIPPEVMPLALLRPVSGSASLALFSDLLKQYGPDSWIGRVASVLQGSTETTFYTVAVYYGAVNIKRTRHTLPASLTADLVGAVMSAAAVRFLFS